MKIFVENLLKYRKINSISSCNKIRQIELFPSVTRRINICLRRQSIGHVFEIVLRIRSEVGNFAHLLGK